MLGRSGPLWERESFDHLIRSLEHYEAFIEYIEQNPVKAELVDKPKYWEASSAARTDLVTDPWPWLFEREE